MAPGDLLTRAAQLEWNGLLLGDDTDYFVTDLQGWHTWPGVDSGNVARAAAHGSFPGRALFQERIVTVEFDVRPMNTDTKALLAALRAATIISDTGTETALVVRDHDTPLLAWGQLLRRDIPMGQGYLRRVEGCALQWACSDPRKYALATESLTIGAPTPGSGALTYPLVYPLDYGTPGTPADGYATNTGDAPAHPVITFTGPVATPLIQNTDTGATLAFNMTLLAGERLVIDTAAGTATYAGGSRLSALTAPSVPLQGWTLPPATTTHLVFRGNSFPAPGATVSLTWRNTWW